MAIAIDYDQPPIPPELWFLMIFMALSLLWIAFGTPGV